MITVFFSYAHEDEDMRDLLEVHLSTLKRQGVISTWHDRRITAGQELDHRISEQLESAQVILLLVSPHFLASEYCYDVELRRAMVRHEEGTASVIPVILHPCDWHSAPFGKLRASPKDGRPVSKHPNIHDAFLDVVQDIRGAAKALVPESGNIAKSRATTATSAEEDVRERVKARSSNLRIRREFSDRERDRFLEESYRYIEQFFENSLAELERRNERVETRLLRRSDTRFTAAIYINGEKRASCTIWLGGGVGQTEGIFYAHSDSSVHGGYNESLSVESDGYTLGLKLLGLSDFRGSAREVLSQQGAAEHLWALLVERLQ